MKTNACLGRDSRTVICDFGTTTLRDGEAVEQAGLRRWRGWQAGWHYEGYAAPYYHWLGAEAG